MSLLLAAFLGIVIVNISVLQISIMHDQSKQ